MNKINTFSKAPAGKSWMVVYTRSKWEKKADQLLQLQGFQSFCPLVRTKRRWADRMKMVEIPLFTSYLFVCVDPLEQLQVLQIAGIINYVHYCGKPAVVPASDIERIRSLVNIYEDIESVSIKNLRQGDQVTFNDGILFDLRGEVLEVHGKSVLIVMKHLDCALIAKIKVNSEDVFLNKVQIPGNYL